MNFLKNTVEGRKMSKTFVWDDEEHVIPDWVDDTKAYVHVFKALPRFFTRAQAAHLLSGIISVSTLSQVDRAGIGPETSVMRGKTVYYRDTFVPWFFKRGGADHDYRLYVKRLAGKVEVPKGPPEGA